MNHHTGRVDNQSSSRFSKRLRVLHVIQFFDVGGLERMVHAVTTGALTHGVDSTVVAYLSNGSYREAFDAAGIETQYIPSSGELQLGVSKALFRVLRSGRFDVVNTHHVGPFLYTFAPAMLNGVPQVQTEHSREMFDIPRFRLLGRTMDLFATVVSVSDEISQFRHQRFGRASRVIPNGVFVPPSKNAEKRAAARRMLSIEENDFVVGCTARLAPEKDLGTLIRGFAGLYHTAPHAKLVIIGDGAERGALEQLVHELAVGPAVRLTGLRSDIDEILPAMDVISLSSTREGLPLALLEGMAFGLPVVATGVGGIPDLLAHGGGLTVPPQDPPAMTLALQRMAGDDLFLRDQGERARQLVVEQYSQDAMVKRYVELYRSLAGRAKRKWLSPLLGVLSERG